MVSDDQSGGSSETDSGSGGSGEASGGSQNGSGGKSEPESGGTHGDGGTDSGDGGSENNPRGTGGDTTNLPMNCEPDDEACQCDDTGCFVTAGGSCTTDGECKNQTCGVTQEALNVCCDEECDDDEVCSEDGSTCEIENPCVADDERCNKNLEVCVAGEWSLKEDCEGRGCRLDFGGCLGDVGDDCSSDSECGEGTCQTTSSQEKVCCSATCGPCQICSPEGSGCVERASASAECACTSSDASNCVDTLSCTQDVCESGSCQNPLKAGFCLINGQCVADGAPDPGNPCRYCNPLSNNQGWTNYQSGTSCDDNLWCNGADTCDGAGLCRHEFTTNRCAGLGDCARTTCSESVRNCFQPETHVCKTQRVTGCLATSCSSDVYEWDVVHYCPGDSTSCSGGDSEELTAQASVVDICTDNESCNTSSKSCSATLGCGNTHCSDGLCWTVEDAAERYTYDGARSYCQNLSFAGRTNWTLPTLDEAQAIIRGCSSSASGGCTPDEGPGVSGCYWPTELGACTGNYWVDEPNGVASFIPSQGGFGPTLGRSMEFYVRCVTVQQ